MLHVGILQHHDTGWARFFRNLKTVAIDECHEYRGIFGTNVAYVLRRLRQICKIHGSDPTFIATSATIADPQQHLHNLVGADFDLVGPEQDGSFQGGRKFWMVNSSEHQYEAGRKLATALADAGLNVLAFCPSRISAERMLAKMRNSEGELPTHYLPTEGVCLVLDQALMAELQSNMEIKLDVAVASAERLMANLFPTVSGPCDSNDYSSGIDKTKTGELAIFLYDNVYDGVNLTELAFDRMPELLSKVQERIESCECIDDCGCIRCIADPMRETQSSKLATLHVVTTLKSIFQAESPETIEFGTGQEFDQTESSEVECPACQSLVSATSKFCSNCGHAMKELTHANS